MVGIENKCPIKPLLDKVFLLCDEDSVKSKSGILSPDVSSDRPMVATVVAVGDEVKGVKVGDVVIFDPFAIAKRKHEGVEYIVLKENKIDGKILE